jgi:type II secretory pathway component PulC
MVSGSQQQTTIETPNVLVVKGITYSEDRKYAVIGTQTVQEGDTVQGTKIKIKKIYPNSVEFEEDGKTWTQPVQNEGS